MKVGYILSGILFISEFLLFTMKRSEKTSENRDQGSLSLFWIMIPVAITLGFTFSNLNLIKLITWNLVPWCLGLFFIGLLIRWIAIIQLGNRFTVNVAVVKEHTLKKDGIYKFIRHPSYSGLLLLFLGIALSMRNYVSILLVIVPVFFAILYRIKVEEKSLKGYFGKDYEDYSKATKKIIPFVY